MIDPLLAGIGHEAMNGILSGPTAATTASG